MAPVPSENARFDIEKQHSIDVLLSLIKLKSKLKENSGVINAQDRNLSSEETVESFLSIKSDYELMKLLRSNNIFKSDLDLFSKSNDSFPRILCPKNHLNSKSPTKASGQRSLQNSSLKLIMSKSDMPMGDLNNMGLQKSNSEVLSQETSLFCKDKNYANHMEQLLKHLGPDILPDCNSADGAGDIENVEEMLQVFKNLDSNNATEPMACDVEMDSIVTASNNENEVIFPMTDSADIAGSLSNFFNEVEMMGICVDDNLADNQFGKDTKLKDRLIEIQNRQFHLQRKNDWLLRRMRKMQARAMTKQASEDVVSFLQYASNSSCEPAPSLKSSVLNCHNTISNDVCRPLKKKIPYPNTSVFFRRLEQSLKQRHSLPSHRPSVKYFGSGSSSSVSRGVTIITPKLNLDVRSELERVSGTSLAHLEAVESALDSDATASSSGAESCDEMQSFNNQHQQYLPIAKRSLWKYVKDRALIGSKWVWLQAQIADLQFKIREYDEFLAKVKTSKKCVELKSDSAGSSNVVINGYHGSLPCAVPSYTKEEDENISHCARTQPFSHTSFCNRKLGRVTDIYKVSKKFVKPSTIMCKCTSPLMCILCAGSKTKVTEASKQLPDSSLSERIAALDPGFHPVLSFSSDVSLSTHLNSLMRVPEWQHGVSRMSVKLYATSRSSDLSCDSVNQEKRLKLAPSVEMFQHRKKLNTLKNSSLYSSGMKKKPGIRGRKPKILKENFNCHSVEKVKAKRAVAVRSVDDEQILVSETGSDIHVSPPASPGHNQSTPVAKVPDRNEFTRRKRENSYDIDNIVIPYSVAAMTRVEKLPYKEILTPKWRIIGEESLTEVRSNEVKTPSQDSDCEDISDDAIALRHERCEKEERAKFRSYLKPSGMSRHRHRRSDNPDSMDFESSSPMTTPPATPQPVIDSLCDQVVLRKRTPSVTKKEKEDGVNSPVDCDEVTPYEPREFPLSEETYKEMLEDNVETTKSLRYTPQYFPISNPEKVCDQSQNVSSASSGSGDSLNLTPEDANDPDWTTNFDNRPWKDKL